LDIGAAGHCDPIRLGDSYGFKTDGKRGGLTTTARAVGAINAMAGEREGYSSHGASEFTKPKQPRQD
jgi:hypothetical protein